MRLPADLRAGLPRTLGTPNLDDIYASISDSVPGGFAGMFLEGPILVVTFVDPGAANEARAEIEQALLSRGLLTPSLDFTRAEFRGARWSFAELYEWYRYILLSRPVLDRGVSSSGIDRKENVINFGVIDEAARARLEARLASLGVSCNLVTTVIQSYATPTKSSLSAVVF